MKLCLLLFAPTLALAASDRPTPTENPPVELARLTPQQRTQQLNHAIHEHGFASVCVAADRVVERSRRALFQKLKLLPEGFKRSRLAYANAPVAEGKPQRTNLCIDIHHSLKNIFATR